MAAIYMWFQRDVQYYTTTLYPIETTDGIQFSISVDATTMGNIESDTYAFSYGFLGGSIDQILLSGPTPEDLYSFSYGFMDAYIDQILLFGPTSEDTYTFSYGFMDAVLEDKLITTYAPDQGITLACTVDSAAWYMDPA